jgi:hypothetical protein
MQSFGPHPARFGMVYEMSPQHLKAVDSQVADADTTARQQVNITENQPGQVPDYTKNLGMAYYRLTRDPIFSQMSNGGRWASFDCFQVIHIQNTNRVALFTNTGGADLDLLRQSPNNPASAIATAKQQNRYKSFPPLSG